MPRIESLSEHVACLRCSEPFQFVHCREIDVSEDPAELDKLLGEPDPLHVCTSCQAQIELRVPLVVVHRGLQLCACVATGWSSVTATWIERARGWAAGAHISVRNRLALKHAILQRASFDARLCSQVPMTERVRIAARWVDMDRSQCAAHLPDLLGSQLGQTLKEALARSIAEASPFQVELRRLVRIAAEAGVAVGLPPVPAKELIDRQVDIVRAFAASPPEQWGNLLGHHLVELDSIAIRICWRSLRGYRTEHNDAVSAMGLARLAHWLASCFGSAYEQAESTYELAMSCLGIGQHEDAVTLFDRALALYLDDLSYQQAAECIKWVGDVLLLNLDKPELAADWYRTGLEALRSWGLSGEVAAISANLAQATYRTGNPTAAHSFAEEAISKAEHHPQAKQIRISALHSLINIRRSMGDRRGACAAAVAMFDLIKEDGHWHAMSQAVSDLVAVALGAREFELGEAMVGETLAHLAESAPASTRDVLTGAPRLVVSGGSQREEPAQLWHLGGQTASWVGRFRLACERFAKAEELARIAGNRDLLRSILRDWAVCLAEMQSFDEARMLLERVVGLCDTPTQLVSAALEGTGILLEGTRRDRSSQASVDAHESLLVEAIQPAVALLVSASALLDPASVDPEQWQEFLWRESHLRAVLAWSTRRVRWDAEAGIELGLAALKAAERIDDPLGRLEALDVLYFAYRDAGRAQLAAQTVIRIAEVFTGAVVETEPAPDGLRRWVEGETRLPGVGLSPDVDGKSHLRAPDPADFMSWSAHAIRSFSLGLLALREHGAGLSEDQVRALSIPQSIWMPRNMGSLGGLDEGAMHRQLGALSRGGSPSVAPERWVDHLAAGYLLLAALSGRRPQWMDEDTHGEWCRQGVLSLTGSLALLGLYRQAYEACPRPPGCEPSSFATVRLLPQWARGNQAFDLWSFAGTLALQCGELKQAEAIADAGIALEGGTCPASQSIAFRLIKAQCCRKRFDLPGVHSQQQACVALLESLASEEERATWAQQVERMARSVASDDLQTRERDLLHLLLSQPGLGSSAEPANDLDEELDRLLSVADHCLSLGRLGEAAKAIDSAEQLVVLWGVESARLKLLLAQARLASNMNDLARAIDIEEEALAILEAQPEPDPHALGVLLGRLGANRLSQLNRPGRPGEMKDSPDLERPMTLLRRSIALHRALGERRDIVINLTNLGLAAWLMGDIMAMLRCQLEALELCANFEGEEAREILYPNSCVKLWMNSSSVCQVLNWLPESVAAARISLRFVSDQLGALVVEDNKLQSLPDRDITQRAAISMMWRSADSAGALPIESGQQGEEWDELRGLRVALGAMMKRYGVPTGGAQDGIAALLEADAGTPDSPLVRHLWEAMEDTKSRLLREQLRNGLRCPPSVPPELREREGTAFAALTHLQRQFQAGQDPATLAAAFKSLASLRAAVAEVWEDMERHGAEAAEYVRLRSGRAAGFESVRAHIDQYADVAPAGALVLVQCFVTMHEVLVFILRSGMLVPEVVQLAVDVEPMSAYCERAFGGASRRNLDLLDWNEWNTVFEPLARLLETWSSPGETIWFVPDSHLHSLPLHAMNVGGRPLAARNPVCYTPSASTMIYCSRKRSGRRARGMSFGDSLSDLPQGREEARVVASAFGVEPIVGIDATRGRVLNALMSDAQAIDVIHFACHIAFDAASPLRSGIILAPEAAGDLATAPRLTAQDILGLELHADLVLLNGCDSGASVRKPGDELLGLCRAWLYAGAACVLATLWPVDDRSSCILMERFAQELGLGSTPGSGIVTKAEALRRAQVHLMNLTREELAAWEATHARSLRDPQTGGATVATGIGRGAMVRSERMAYWREHSGSSHAGQASTGEHPFRNPYYWAPFVLVGDPG